MLALRGLAEAGLVRRLGLSNVNLAELEVALDVLGGPDDGRRRVGAERVVTAVPRRS